MSKTASGLLIFRCIDSSIHFLLLKASYPPFHWTPPKGHVDPGESTWDTALRETEEEAGIKPEDLDVYKDICRTLKYNVNGKPKTVFYWLARLKDPYQKIILSNEHTEYAWLVKTAVQEKSGFSDFNSMLAELEAYVLEKAAS